MLCDIITQKDTVEMANTEVYLPVHHLHQSQAKQVDCRRLQTFAVSQTDDSNECLVSTSRCYQRCPTV